jgi:SAM-dependent methyltransferase
MDNESDDAPQPGVYSLHDATRPEKDLGPDAAETLICDLVGADRRVLLLAVAAGRVSSTLKQQGCTVIEPSLTTDLDALDRDLDRSERFDVIVLADVLKRVKDPLRLLQTLRELLAPEGFFVFSLPNVAHGSVRLALLAGRFPYQDAGLLSQAQLRFFTRETIGALLDDAELAAAEIRHQNRSLDASEVPFDREALPVEAIREVERDPDAEIYRFVIKACPLDAPGLREMQRRMRELAQENARLRPLEAEVRRLQEALAGIAGREGQLRASLIEAHDQLLQRDEQLSRLLETPVGRLYSAARRLRQLARGAMHRAARYRAALRRS